MSITALLDQNVTILGRAPGTDDAHGNPTSVWAAQIVVRGRLEQVSTLEQRGGRDTVVTALRLYLAAGAPLSAQSRVQVAGATYEVVGDPSRPRGRRGEDHVEATVQGVTG